jgi:hypothetical protein
MVGTDEAKSHRLPDARLARTHSAIDVTAGIAGGYRTRSRARERGPGRYAGGDCFGREPMERFARAREGIRACTRGKSDARALHRQGTRRRAGSLSRHRGELAVPVGAVVASARRDARVIRVVTRRSGRGVGVRGAARVFQAVLWTTPVLGERVVEPAGRRGR